jgi:hypothetical protein
MVVNIYRKQGDGQDFFDMVVVKKMFRMNAASFGQLLKSWANRLGIDTAAEGSYRPNNDQ